MAIDTVSNFLAKHGRYSLERLRELFQFDERYKIIGEEFEVSHVAVVGWWKKFFVKEVKYNQETEQRLRIYNQFDMDAAIEEHEKIERFSLKLIQGGRRA